MFRKKTPIRKKHKSKQQEIINLQYFVFKVVTKSYFTHYSCVVIVFFNTALCRSSFSTVSFRKLVFRLFVLSLNQDIKICVIILCNLDVDFVLTLNKNSPFINNKLFIKILQCYVKIYFQRCFEFFKKNSFIKKSVKQSKNKECKKRYHKKINYQSFSSVYNYCIPWLYSGP